MNNKVLKLLQQSVTEYKQNWDISEDSTPCIPQENLRNNTEQGLHMSKRTEDLAFKYNINASVDELSLFVSEVYNDGYHDGKAFKERHMTVRDQFASSAMQSLINVYVNTGNETPDNEYLSRWAYQTADAMLKAREAGDGEENFHERLKEDLEKSDEQFGEINT